MKNKFGYVSFQCFTNEQVKEINKKIKENILQKQDPSDASSTASKVGEFFNVPCPPLMDLLCPWLYNCQYANREVFGLVIDWDFHLDHCNYNIYGENGEYGWHIDANHKNEFDMKLTCLLNLSEEPYEGGELCLINNGPFAEKIKFDSGMGIVFNSLIAHKVTPITQGERITLTYWGTGPAWK